MRFFLVRIILGNRWFFLVRIIFGCRWFLIFIGVSDAVPILIHLFPVLPHDLFLFLTPEEFGHIVGGFCITAFREFTKVVIGKKAPVLRFLRTWPRKRLILFIPCLRALFDLRSIGVGTRSQGTGAALDDEVHCHDDEDDHDDRYENIPCPLILIIEIVIDLFP